MRVICPTFDEFLQCLSSEQEVFQDTVRVSAIRRHANGKSNRDATVFDVVLQASAVVVVDENSEYILEVGVDCGRDYEDGQGEKVGSYLAAAHKSELKKLADTKGWKLMPGVVDY